MPFMRRPKYQEYIICIFTKWDQSHDSLLLTEQTGLRSVLVAASDPVFSTVMSPVGAWARLLGYGLTRFLRVISDKGFCYKASVCERTALAICTFMAPLVFLTQRAGPGPQAEERNQPESSPICRLLRHLHKYEWEFILLFCLCCGVPKYPMTCLSKTRKIINISHTAQP